MTPSPAAPPRAATPMRLIKDTTTAGFRQDVIAESMHGRSWSISGRRGAAPASSSPPFSEKVVKAAKGAVASGQDEHRRPSLDRRPARHPVDPRRDRLPEGPAGRRLHGRGAREPDQGADRSPSPARPRIGRGGARRCRRPDRGGRPRGRLRDLRGRARAAARQRDGARRTAKMQLDAGEIEKRQARAGHVPEAKAAARRCARASAPPSNSPSRRPPSATCRACSEEARPTGRSIRRGSTSPWASRPTANAAKRSIHLIELRKRDKDWNDDAARKQLLQFFRGVGRDGSRHDPGTAQALGAPVLVMRQLAWASFRPAFGPSGRRHVSTMRATRPGGLPRRHLRSFRCPAPCCCRAARCPSTSSSARYLSMIDDAMRTDRIFGMIQPDPDGSGAANPSSTGSLRGRITHYAETGDGRYLVS